MAGIKPASQLWALLRKSYWWTGHSCLPSKRFNFTLLDLVDISYFGYLRLYSKDVRSHCLSLKSFSYLPAPDWLVPITWNQSSFLIGQQLSHWRAIFPHYTPYKYISVIKPCSKHTKVAVYGKIALLFSSLSVLDIVNDGAIRLTCLFLVGMILCVCPFTA